MIIPFIREWEMEFRTVDTGAYGVIKPALIIRFYE
jgi:hypothetical protein